MLATDPTGLLARARRWADEIGADAEAVTSEARVGGGGAPGVVLASAAVALPERFAAPLRRGEPAVVGRVHGGRLLLDLLDRAGGGRRGGDRRRTTSRWAEDA